MSAPQLAGVLTVRLDELPVEPELVVPEGRVGYYVSARLGVQYALLLGPYCTHVEALDRVSLAPGLSRGVDARAAFLEYGTARVEVRADRELPAGRLLDPT